MTLSQNISKRLLHIPAEGVELEGELILPSGTEKIVLFAHGSGSSRHSPRNQFVAERLNQSQIGTLLFDLLTPQEDETYRTRFNIALLTNRLIQTTTWFMEQEVFNNMKFGYFGASTGAAAALLAAAELGNKISAVVSRGGRPDLAGQGLAQVKSPTLLLVGGWDDVVIELNRQAFEILTCEKKMTIIPEATHLFEEPGKLEEVADHASKWFLQYL
jgi:dienelactone hydrolase